MWTLELLSNVTLIHLSISLLLDEMLCICRKTFSIVLLLKTTHSIQILNCIWNRRFRKHRYLLLLLFSHSASIRLFVTPWSAALQASPVLTRAFSKSCPLNWQCHTAILLSVIPFLSWLNLSQNQGL